MKHGLTPRARTLRRDGTDAEHLLWRHLRNRQIVGSKFRRQVPIDHYIVDFLCADARLIVEVDGGQHSEEADAVRTEYLISAGFRLIRFWNHDVLTNVEGVMDRVVKALRAPPHPDHLR